MKKLALTYLVMMISFVGYCQIETPQPSPTSKIEQKVGLTDVTLEYSRPGMRDRKIFGNLVPFGKLWRTGANGNTKITFSDDVSIDGQELKAGTYAIYTIPNEKAWDVIFYSESTNWGTPEKWDDAKIVAKVTAEVYNLPMSIETFTMSFDDLKTGGATLGIMWENSYVGIEFNVPTDDKVLTSINDVMNGTPTANDYYAAAVYYSQENKDIKTALKWMEKAMSMTEKPAFWQLRQQSLIYAKDGNKEAAIESAKKSLAGAEEAGNADYVKMNKDSLVEWGAM
jgi:hypothetical protein